jgi:hypothetical protein
MSKALRAARRLDQKAHMTKSPPNDRLKNDRLKNWLPQSTQELKALWLQGQAIALAQQQGQHEVYKQERERDQRSPADATMMSPPAVPTEPQLTQTVQETTNPLPEKAAPTTPYQGDGNDEVLLEGTFRMFEKLKAERAQKEAMEAQKEASVK